MLCWNVPPVTVKLAVASGPSTLGTSTPRNPVPRRPPVSMLMMSNVGVVLLVASVTDAPVQTVELVQAMCSGSANDGIATRPSPMMIPPPSSTIAILFISRLPLSVRAWLLSPETGNAGLVPQVAAPWVMKKSAKLWPSRARKAERDSGKREDGCRRHAESYVRCAFIRRGRRASRGRDYRAEAGRRAAPRGGGSERLESPRRRRQLALGDLVEQRLVADLENARGLGAIPLHAIEHFHEGFTLGFPRAAARDLPQALAGDRCGRMGRGVPVPLARNEGLERLLAVRENHHASNHVLQLSDVSRPRVLGEASHRLGRELLCATVLLVESREER